MRNLSDALQDAIRRSHSVTRAVAAQISSELAAAHLAEQAASRLASAAERRKAATHAPRQARHAEVLRLCAGGASVAGIARGLGLDRKTVSVWLSREEPPLWTRRPQPSVIDPYRPHLERRWSEGCRNAAALARELEALGAEIKPRVVRAWATLRRRATVDGLDARPSGEGVTWKSPSVTGLVCLLQGDPGGGEGPDAAFVERLRAQVPDLDCAAALARRLGQMLRRSSKEKLADWLAEAGTSLLRRFAEGLQRDREGIENAMATSWTTSPVKGQISRLKLIKRQMYGRAGFELLRQCVLNAA